MRPKELTTLRSWLIFLFVWHIKIGKYKIVFDLWEYTDIYMNSPTAIGAYVCFYNHEGNFRIDNSIHLLWFKLSLQIRWLYPVKRVENDDE